MNVKSNKIKVYDMTCTSCEKIIERTLKKLVGVLNSKANYVEQTVYIEFDSELCSLQQIKHAIVAAGYVVEKPNNYKALGIFIISAAIIFLGTSTGGYDMNNMLSGASYIVIFIVGLLTSIHCVGMCGGIMISQSISKNSINKFEAIKPALLYNLGRVISYTVLGGIVGTVGSVFSLNLRTQAAIQIIAALFMIIMGLNMSGFSLFRKINLKLPWSYCSLKKKPKTPLVVGILNGLMPCGPLQTMQLYALSTGSAFKGALSMLIFALGTVPLMLIFGAASGMLSKGYTKSLLKLSGIFILILGLIMGNRGLALAGMNISPASLMMRTQQNKSLSNGNASKATIENGVQIIKITADRSGYSPNVLYIQKDIPVKLVVDGKQITSCNNEIVLPSLNIKKKLTGGDNLIEFTPTATDIKFSCWMGMINGVIKVVPNLNAIDTSTTANTPPSSSGGCCNVPQTSNSENK